ncbi:MAG: hypothetical protein BWY66_00861 [bacterium ADurb.Bin374]|nr:MAG: hypothetical protein BWY66_00861 [bacterium ADurb.Bin374]
MPQVGRFLQQLGGLLLVLGDPFSRRIRDAEQQEPVGIILLDGLCKPPDGFTVIFFRSFGVLVTGGEPHLRLSVAFVRELPQLGQRVFLL